VQLVGALGAPTAEVLLVVDREHGRLVDALEARREDAQAVVDVLEGHAERLVVEPDGAERLPADELERGGHRAAGGHERLGEVGGPVEEAVAEPAVQGGEVDAGVLEQAVGVQQPGADDRGGAPGGVRAGAHAVEPARLGELDVGVDQHGVHPVGERELEPGVHRGGEAGVGVGAHEGGAQLVAGELHEAGELGLGAVVVDDEDRRVRRGLAQGDEAAQDDVELLLAAEIGGDDRQCGARVRGHAPVIGPVRRCLRSDEADGPVRLGEGPQGADVLGAEAREGGERARGLAAREQGERVARDLRSRAGTTAASSPPGA
jgi:hypothetical protein